MLYEHRSVSVLTGLSRSFVFIVYYSICIPTVEIRRRNVDPMEDPDYTLIVRVQDLGGASANALSGNTYVKIIVKQNLWANPGPITVKEHLMESYPYVIAKVRILISYFCT